MNKCSVPGILHNMKYRRSIDPGGRNIALGSPYPKKRPACRMIAADSAPIPDPERRGDKAHRIAHRIEMHPMEKGGIHHHRDSIGLPVLLKQSNTGGNHARVHDRFKLSQLIRIREHQSPQPFAIDAAITGDNSRPENGNKFSLRLAQGFMPQRVYLYHGKAPGNKKIRNLVFPRAIGSRQSDGDQCISPHERPVSMLTLSGIER